MKIGIISDTHDNCNNLTEILRILKKEGIETIIHLGDIVSPFCVDRLNVKMVYAVFGNNDGDKLLLQSRFQKKGYIIKKGPYDIEIDSVKFAIMHEPFELDAFIKSQLYDVVCYGHTHELEIREGKPLVINPGEAGGWLSEPTFVILKLPSLEYRIVHI